MKTTYEIKLAVVVDRIDDSGIRREIHTHRQPAVIIRPVIVSDPMKVDAAIEELCKTHSDLPKYKKVTDEVRPEKTV